MREASIKKRDSGFTLVEVLIAVAILSIISIPVVQSFVSVAQVNGQARRRLAANTIAETLMESCKSVSLLDVIVQCDVNGNANGKVYIITNADGTVFSGRAFELQGDLSTTTKSATGTAPDYELTERDKYAFLLLDISSGGGKYSALIQYEVDKSGRNHGADDTEHEGATGKVLKDADINYLKYYKVTISVYRTSKDVMTFLDSINKSDPGKNAIASIEGSVADDSH